MRLPYFLLALLAGCFALAGCGGTSSGYLRVDTPIIQFVPPEPSDLIEEPDDDEGDGDAGDSDEAGEDESSAAPAPVKSPA